MTRTPVVMAFVLVCTVAPARADEPPSRVPVAEDYSLHCAACHRLDGSGTPGIVPTLHGVGSLLVEAGGRDYLVRVPGVAQAPLSDARLARLLNWVVLEFSGVEAQPRFSADEVGRRRAAPLRDPARARRQLSGAPNRAR